MCQPLYVDILRHVINFISKDVFLYPSSSQQWRSNLNCVLCLCAQRISLKVTIPPHFILEWNMKDLYSHLTLIRGAELCHKFSHCPIKVSIVFSISTWQLLCMHRCTRVNSLTLGQHACLLSMGNDMRPPPLLLFCTLASNSGQFIFNQPTLRDIDNTL